MRPAGAHSATYWEAQHSLLYGNDRSAWAVIDLLDFYSAECLVSLYVNKCLPVIEL